MNDDELESIWKGAVVAKSRNYPQNFSGKLKKSTENLNYENRRLDRDSNRVPPKYILACRYTNLFGSRREYDIEFICKILPIPLESLKNEIWPIFAFPFLSAIIGSIAWSLML
jgi:hypothetical protein